MTTALSLLLSPVYSNLLTAFEAEADLATSDGWIYLVIVSRETAHPEAARPADGEESGR